MKVSCAVVIQDRKVLIQKRLRRGTMISEFPMGKLEDEDTYESAALRELREETGLKGSLTEISPFIYGSETGAQVGFVIVSICVQDRPTADPIRRQSFSWCKISEIPIHDFHRVDQEFIMSKLKQFVDL